MVPRMNNKSRIILKKISDGNPFSDQIIIDNVIMKINIINKSLPLVFCFSNAAERAVPNDINYIPWGYNFILKEGLNVCSFASIGDANWYRSPDFHSFLKLLGENLHNFPIKLGYGASMGGFAIGAFYNVLDLSRVLLFNPISSLNNKIVPWESRFKRPARNFDWNGEFNDIANKNLNGYIIYDPIYTLDHKHAVRYKSLTHLRLPGVGHGFPFHIHKMDFLKRLFREFINNNINEFEFYKLSRRRRQYRRYYKWLLSDENTHLTTKRREVIEFYKKIYEAKNKQQYFISKENLDHIKESIILLSDKDKNLAKSLLEILIKNKTNQNFINHYDKLLKQHD